MSRLEHRTYTVEQLVHDYRGGRLVIPEFQRDYVWKPNRAPKLLDSLYHGYPVSSLLVWQGGSDVTTRRKAPKALGGPKTNWLIDGQQRVITLSRIFSGDEGIDVVFHLKTEEFQRPNAATRSDPDWVRVADVWDEEGFRRLRRNLERDSLEARLEQVRRILDYEIPAVHMVDHGFDAAVSAFERINTLGVKLRTQDVESARIAAKHSGFIRDHVVPKLEDLRRKGFDRITVTQLFRACAFVAHPDGRRRTPLQELSTNELHRAWKETLRGVDRAIDLVRSELGLGDMKVLWSGSLLVPAIALCATAPARERNDAEIAGWMALAALTHRYSVSSETALDQDLRACRSSDPIRALLKNLRKGGTLRASPRDFDASLSDRGGLFAVHVACRQRGILDLFSGRKMLLQSAVDRHHLFPRAQFSPKQRASADCLANIAFVTDQANRSVGAASPDVYLAELKTKVLESQCIPTDQDLWRIKSADAFWAARRQLLADAFNEFLAERFEDRKLVG